MIDREKLVKAVLALFDEGYLGAQGRGTWYIDGEPGSGLFGSIEKLDAATASRPLTPGDPLSAASHVAHVRFALSLANRAAAGENPYPGADWAGSWDTRIVDEASWKSLVEGLKKEVEEFRLVIASGTPLEDEEFATGSIGLICHTAWHLGALRQALGLIRAPTRKGA